MRHNPSLRGHGFRALSSGIVTLFLFVWLAPLCAVSASNHYSEKQLEALAERVGKIYWVVSMNDRTPSFLTTPAPNASSFRAQPNESFEITELTGQKAKNPYYKVKFSSGKEGYIRPDAFHEELNVTILTLDPQADEKKKAALAAQEDKKRVDWIKAQPWSQAVKEAALKRQAVPGMNGGEVKRVVGSPTRVSRVQAPQRVAEEHWIYPDGSVLIFQNGLLTRIEPKDNNGR